MHYSARFVPAAVAAMLTAACLLVAGAQDEPQTPAGDLFMPFVTLRGDDSRIEEPTFLRIMSAKDFQDTFMRHLGEKPEAFDDYYNPHGVPEIDFDRCMVIAIFQGKSWNSAGVVADSVIEEPDLIRFRYSDQSYQTAGPDGGGQRVTAFGFFVVPRSEKALVLENDVQRYIGEPPEWKETARFEALK